MRVLKKLTLVSLTALCAQPAFAALTYIPSGLKPASAKILVVLQGCQQSAEMMALGTGWNQIAEKNNLVVLYPQIPEGADRSGCWSWYLPDNQRADSGQLRRLIEDVRALRSTLNLEQPEIFVAGFSSGAAMASALLACYPNEFKAGAIHSGPSYGLAQTRQESDRVLKENPTGKPQWGTCRPRDFSGSLIVIQGSADTTVHPQHGLRIISDFIGNTNSISTQEIKVGEFTYAMTDYSSPKPARGRLVMIQGLGHKWSGFSLDAKSKEPSATQIIWEYFKEIPSQQGKPATK